jgi:hypothetical protein
MARFRRELDKCIDKFLPPVAGQKRVHGGDQDHDSANEDHEDCVGGSKAGVERKMLKVAGRRTTKKVKRDDGRLLACPFYKHDPARYGKVKTCMGPGWSENHRVK